MTQHPTNAQLMAATIVYLEGILLPTLSGEHRFKTRLAVNALKILQRSQLEEHDDTAQESPTPPEALETLAETIRQKKVALEDPVMLLALERQLRQSLQINNQKWLTG